MSAAPREIHRRPMLPLARSSLEEPPGRSVPGTTPLLRPSTAGLQGPERTERPPDGGLESGRPSAMRRRRAPVRGVSGGVAGRPWASSTALKPKTEVGEAGEAELLLAPLPATPTTVAGVGDGRPAPEPRATEVAPVCDGTGTASATGEVGEVASVVSDAGNRHACRSSGIQAPSSKTAKAANTVLVATKATNTMATTTGKTTERPSLRRSVRNRKGSPVMILNFFGFSLSVLFSRRALRAC
ncbi:hypothetical protein BRADI_3g32709v3 [Brachypodium distachyon]|uniref:Uncharacterized protein n=1 Tax=Brachypodium distachyon TaxID=15368 RepID=A0A2K2D0N0_BRADI|nr:hypothetical protein BRADI_3g32709v3 [Brachypodium distachyon]